MDNGTNTEPEVYGGLEEEASLFKPENKKIKDVFDIIKTQKRFKDFTDEYQNGMFFKNNKLTIIAQKDPLKPSASATTRKLPNGDAIIYLNPDKLLKENPSSIAKSILHEAAHCFVHGFEAKITNNKPRISGQDRSNYAVLQSERNVYAGFSDAKERGEHEYMAKWMLNEIIQGIKDYNLLPPHITNDHYKALVLLGLTTTTTWTTFELQMVNNGIFIKNLIDEIKLCY